MCKITIVPIILFDLFKIESFFKVKEFLLQVLNHCPMKKILANIDMQINPEVIDLNLYKILQPIQNKKISFFID